MIKLFLPKKKIRFNNHTEVVDEIGNVLFLFNGNFFQTEIRLSKPDGTVLFHAKLAWSFKRRYDIYQGDAKISSIIAKSLFSHYRYDISSFMENLSCEGNLQRSEFFILKKNVVVLSIGANLDKRYYRVIEVDENNTEYLVMLMFSLIVASFDIG